MRLPIFLLVFVFSTAPTAFAQVIDDRSDYHDLFDLYVFKKYEKCLHKALRYTEQEKHRRDAEPFLFASVCYYLIHLHPENFDPDIVKRPLKEALKYAYRFKKRDRLWLLREKNREYLSDLRTASLKLALLHLQLDDYRKADYYLKWTAKVYPDDYVTRLAQGISQVLNNNIYEGERNITKSYELINEHLNESDDIEIAREVKPVLGDFLVNYMQYWDQKKNRKKCLQTIAIAHLLLGEKSEFWAKSD